MSGSPAWEPLRDELARWQDAGRVAQLWWRDDDAVEPTAALDTLLDLSKGYAAPITLAVIPAHTGDALSERLSAEQRVNVAVHGWSHENHAPEGEKKQELGGHRLTESVLGELYHGFLNLQRLYPGQFIPMLVPPWNRIDRGFIPKLSPLGFECLSTYGRAGAAGPIGVLNTHVDIMDWHGTRGGRPDGDLVAELVIELKDRFEGRDEPIGLLTHHLVHDMQAWDFCQRLFDETSGHEAVAWKAAAGLMED